MYCLFLHFLSRAYPASQSLQRAKGVFTPFPQPVQGNVPPPLASQALCALQCSPRQLFPHTSTVPNSSQRQVFVPFIVMLWYTLSTLDEQRCAWVRGGAHLPAPHICKTHLSAPQRTSSLIQILGCREVRTSQHLLDLVIYWSFISIHKQLHGRGAIGVRTSWT